jgi:hypothetical protein
MVENIATIPYTCGICDIKYSDIGRCHIIKISCNFDSFMCELCQDCEAEYVIPNITICRGPTAANPLVNRYYLDSNGGVTAHFPSIHFFHYINRLERWPLT